MDGKGHIEGWTAEEVVEFLTTLDLEQYSDGFIENGITGDILVHLDHEALRDIGVESVGHRLNILRAVYNIKVTDNVPIEADHYVPATVDFESTVRATTSEISKDLVAITEAIQVRDERLLSAETEIKRLTELLSRMKDQLTPVFKIVKELQPLPNPEAPSPSTTPTSATPTITSSSSVSRKFSTKKLLLGGSTLKQTSPTHIPSSYLYTSEPESPRSPNKHLEIPTITRPPTSMDSNAPTPRSAIPPPRPPPPGSSASSTLGTIKRDPRDLLPPLPDAAAANGTAATSSSAAAASSASADAFKSFRVGLDDSCSKVLPVALKKYKINSDWRDYSLFICYADQERCLGLDEKPLLIFQELQKANKSPVFMLRRIENTAAASNAVRTHDQEMRF